MGGDHPMHLGKLPRSFLKYALAHQIVGTGCREVPRSAVALPAGVLVGGSGAVEKGIAIVSSLCSAKMEQAATALGGFGYGGGVARGVRPAGTGAIIQELHLRTRGVGGPACGIVLTVDAQLQLQHSQRQRWQHRLWRHRLQRCERRGAWLMPQMTAIAQSRTLA